MVRFGTTRFAALLGLAACNAVFGIEEGLPEPVSETGTEDPLPDQTSVSDAAGGSGGGSRAGGSGSPSTLGAGGGGGAAGSAALPSNGGSAAPDGGIDDTTALPGDLAIAAEALLFTSGLYSHPLGISGSLGTTKSPVGAAIEPDCADDAACFAAVSGDTACVTGTVERVTDGDYVNGWGVNLQLNMAGAAWDRGGGVIKGISFVLSGATLPTMRFHATRPATAEEPSNNYCRELQPVSGQRVDIVFDDLRIACWNPAAATVLPPDVILDTLGWQINAVADRAKPFDFCVGQLRPILEAE